MTLREDPDIRDPRDLFFWNDDAGALHALQLDLIRSGSHEKAKTLTKSPIESGAQVADHSVKDPDSLTFEIGHSSRPIYTVEGFAPKSLDLGAVSVTTLAETDTDFGLDRVANVRSVLLDLFDRDTLIRVEYDGQIFENMVLISYKTVSQKGSTDLRVWQIVLEKLVTVESEVVPIPIPVQARLRRKKRKGKKASKDADRKTSGDRSSTRKSMLKQMGDGLFSSAQE